MKTRQSGSAEPWRISADARRHRLSVGTWERARLLWTKLSRRDWESKNISSALRLISSRNIVPADCPCTISMYIAWAVRKSSLRSAPGIILRTGVCVIEWADLIAEEIPPGSRLIRISYGEEDGTAHLRYRYDRMKILVIDTAGATASVSVINEKKKSLRNYPMTE